MQVPKAARALLIAVFSTAALAADNPNPWQSVEDSDGIRVLTREVPNSSIREVMAQTSIDAPAARVWDVVTQTEYFTEFMPYVVEARRLTEPTNGEGYEYERLDPPLVAMRDYAIKVQIRTDPKTGALVRTWTAAPDKAPPPLPGVVRLTVVDGSWTIEPLTPSSCRLTYWLYTDPGGLIPAWIANRANKTSVPDLLRAVRSRAKNPEWHR